jgi:TP901 family phage tail tape measure protein
MTTGQYDAMIRLGVDATQSLRDITSQLQTVGNTVEKTLSTKAKNSGKTLKNEVSDGISSGAKQGAAQTDSIFSTITKQVKNRLTLTLAQGIIDAYKSALKSVVSNVKELNDAQTEFKKVSDLSGSSLNAYTQKAAEMGRTVGRTATEMISAATEFRKSSYNDEDSLVLARLASLYQNVADEELSAGEAASFMIAQMKAGFSDVEDSTDGALYAINAINAVSNAFAVSSGDLANNIGKTSAAMATGNVTYAQTIGLMTGMTEVTRNAATSATSLNRIQSRFNQIIDETSSTGKKLSAWYSEHGIEVKDQNGDLRSLYDVLSDVSKQWGSLSKSEKDYYLLTQGSATQANRLAALLNNYADVKEAVAVATKSENSAAKENAKYQESLAYAIQNLKAAWVQLSNDLIKSGALTKLVNAATSVVDIFDKMANTIGGLPTIFISMVTSVGLLSVALKGLSSISGVGQLAKQLAGIGTASASVGKAATAMTTTATAADVATATGVTGKAKATKDTLSKIGVVKQLSKYAELKNEQKALVETTDELRKSVTNYKGELIKLNDLETAAQSIRKKGITQEEKQAILAARKATNTKNKAEALKAIKDFDPTMKSLKESDELIGKNEASLLAMKGSINATVGALAGLAAGIAVIAGMKFANDIYQETYGFSSNVEKANKTSKELTKTQKQIDELLEKQNNSAEGLTAKEKRQLQILQAEESSLKRQLKLYEDRAKKAASKEAKKEFKSYESPSGGITASEMSVGTEFLNSGDKIKEQKKQIGYLNSAIDQLLEKRQEYIEQGKDTSEIDERITNYNSQLKEEKSQLKELKEEQKELAAETIQKWEEMKAEFGDYYKSLDKESKAAYDNLHRQAILALDGVEDEVANLASDMVSLFGSNTYDAFDLDLTSFQSAEELTQAISDKLATMGDKQIKLYARDEAGNIIDTIKVKASELSAKEWQLIINAQTTGNWEEVKEYEKLNPNQKKFAEIVTTIKKDQSGTANLFSKEQLNPKVTVKYKPNYAAITSRNSKIVNTPITQWVTYRYTNKKKAKGKRKGEEGGTAWLGDEGDSQNPKPELVVGKNGAYLAGTGGWELFNLDNSDTVYSYSQTKKLLGNNLSGSDSASPMYASGTNNEAFDNALEELEYKRDVNHWTDEYYAQQYRALYNRYGSGSLSTSQVHSYGKYIEEVATDKAKAEIERLQGVLEETGEGLTELVNKISKDSHFSADEKQELLEEAYQASVKYNTEEYKNGKDTRAKILEDIKAYYKVRGAYDEEYYSMLNDLREADQDLEVERLETLSDVEDKKLSLAEKYLQQQLDLINKQIDANEDEADSMEDLKDLQQDLADARSDMVKIYREGVGWVYEQNSEAIKEAQDAIEDYNKEHMSDELQAQADALETIIDLFDEMQDLSDIKELELALGVNSLTELTNGDFGTNIKLWTEWIKNAIATQVGLEDLSTQIKNATGTGIDEWLGDVFSSGSHQASSSVIANYIAKHSFASGTLSANGGLSLVGEHGAELTWLNKGSAVFPNTVSRNLMQWGTYSPAQLLSGVNNSTTQTFNFKEIVLPNVKNADDFYRELQRLPNMAIQKSAQRA